MTADKEFRRREGELAARFRWQADGRLSLTLSPQTPADLAAIEKFYDTPINLPVPGHPPGRSHPQHRRL
jgi:hypothetical protein